MYACPLCLNQFSHDRVGELTEDHVPQRSIGAKLRVLTCRGCNNRAGAQFEGHLKTDRSVREFDARQTSSLQRGQLSLDGITLNAQVGLSGPYVHALIPQADNDPARYEAAQAQAVLGGMNFVAVTTRHRANLDAVGRAVYKTAYLAAFALLGYRYTLYPAVQRIRGAIATGLGGRPWPNMFLFHKKPIRNAVIESWTLQNGADCIFVAFGDYGVVLPGVPWRETGGDIQVTVPSFEHRWSDDDPNSLPDACMGEWPPKPRSRALLPWPERPQYVLDALRPLEITH